MINNMSKLSTNKFKTVSIEFRPDQPGEYEFQSMMGMLKGKLVAE